jgi:ribonuclease HI
MEIMGAVKGLEFVLADPFLSKAEEIILISDSQLVLNWATGDYQVKKPHLIPYVIKLRKVFRALKATTRWEKGHRGEVNNERCDELAKAAREKAD